jgi:hypothetical protein
VNAPDEIEYGEVRYVRGDLYDAVKFTAQLNKETIEAMQRAHPDYGTPNWCPECSPKNKGYCGCEIACNE